MTNRQVKLMTYPLQAFAAMLFCLGIYFASVRFARGETYWALFQVCMCFADAMLIVFLQVIRRRTVLRSVPCDGVPK